MNKKLGLQIIKNSFLYIFYSLIFSILIILILYFLPKRSSPYPNEDGMLILIVPGVIILNFAGIIILLITFEKKVLTIISYLLFIINIFLISGLIIVLENIIIFNMDFFLLFVGNLNSVLIVILIRKIFNRKGILKKKI